ncbi:amidohydrolase family protein [Nonomuraea sp. NPDC050556]|uniref:amidohydrolase family protein n=1 Tax=Nonomuraea sp. NPDC050556 TaxID=3364369 RepID=UPI0037B68F22
MRTLITGVRVFDGERTVPSADVLIDGRFIAEPDDSPVDVRVDGTGKTLLPGLIDAHTHVFDGDLARALTFGVTTELDMFCLPGNLARQRRLAIGDDVADLRSAGVLATAPGGHPSQLMASAGSYGDAAGPFDTIDDPARAEAFVQARLSEGADYLKIVVDSSHGLPVLAPAVVVALVEAGHAAGLRVVAHAVTVGDAQVVLDAGVDGLAHVVPGMGASLASRVASQGVFVVTTLAYFESSAVPGLDRAAERSVDAARALLEAGVPLLAGTDANPWAPRHGSSLHRELFLLTSAGLTPSQALTSATSVTAHHFGLTDRGRIAPGLRADLLLVDGDPTTDIDATTAITTLWRNGIYKDV